MIFGHVSLVAVQLDNLVAILNGDKLKSVLLESALHFGSSKTEMKRYVKPNVPAQLDGAWSLHLRSKRGEASSQRRSRAPCGGRWLLRPSTSLCLSSGEEKQKVFAESSIPNDRPLTRRKRKEMIERADISCTYAHDGSSRESGRGRRVVVTFQRARKDNAKQNSTLVLSFHGG